MVAFRALRWHTVCIRGSVPILVVTATHSFLAVECVRAVLALVECRYKQLTVLRLAVRHVVALWLFVMPRGTRLRLARLKRDVLV